MKISAHLALFFCLWISPSFAFEMSGHDLLGQLKDYYIEKGITEKELLNAGRGYGYISGVYDAMREKFKIPNDVKPPQIVSIVYQFLINHPNLLYKRASSVVNQALLEAFPQEKKE